MSQGSTIDDKLDIVSAQNLVDIAEDIVRDLVRTVDRFVAHETWRSSEGIAAAVPACIAGQPADCHSA